MVKYAVVNGADRGFGLSITEKLLERGYHVIAGKFLAEYNLLEDLSGRFPGRLAIVYMDTCNIKSLENAANAARNITGRIDLIVSNAALMGNGKGQDIRSILDTEHMLRTYNTNSVGALRFLSAFLPLMEKGDKRICVVSSEISSLSLLRRTEYYSYASSKSALNMGVRLAFNELRPKGYTFRLYHPGWMKRQAPDGSPMNTGADFPAEFSAGFAIDFFLNDREDEDRLVLIDYTGLEWPF